jgi:hypothetical protein
MGGNKSVTRFFVTSKGLGKGGDLGGLTGADAHCQALADAQVSLSMLIEGKAAIIEQET